MHAQIKHILVNLQDLIPTLAGISINSTNQITLFIFADFNKVKALLEKYVTVLATTCIAHTKTEFNFIVTVY